MATSWNVACGCFLFHRKKEIRLPHDAERNQIIFYFRISLTFESFFRTRLHAASFAMATKISWNLALFNFSEKEKQSSRLKRPKYFTVEIAISLRSTNGYSFLGEGRKPTKTSVSWITGDKQSFRDLYYIRVWWKSFLPCEKWQGTELLINRVDTLTSVSGIGCSNVG